MQSYLHVITAGPGPGHLGDEVASAVGQSTLTCPQSPAGGIDAPSRQCGRG